MIFLGAPPEPLALPTIMLIFKRCTVGGSLIGGIAETQEMLVRPKPWALDILVPLWISPCLLPKPWDGGALNPMCAAASFCSMGICIHLPLTQRTTHRCSNLWALCGRVQCAADFWPAAFRARCVSCLQPRVSENPVVCVPRTSAASTASCRRWRRSARSTSTPPTSGSPRTTCTTASSLTCRAPSCSSVCRQMQRL